MIGYKKIFLIRHGETDMNKLKILQGSELDTPLNSQGIIQAMKTGLYLASKQSELETSIIIASPLERARHTAEILRSYIINTDWVLDINIIEVAHGRLSGLSKTDPLRQLYYELENIYNNQYPDPIDRNSQNKYEWIHKAFEQRGINLGAETTDSLEQRSEHILRTILDTNYDTYYIVSHGSFLEYWIPRLIGIHQSINIKGDMTRGTNCWISYLIYDGTRFNMITPPNTEHFGLIE